MNLRNLTFHAHSQWLTILLDESFGRLQRCVSVRTFLRRPLSYFEILGLKRNLPSLLNHYSEGEHDSLGRIAAYLMGCSHCLDIEPGSLGADCRAIYVVSLHLEGWADRPDANYCNLSENDEEDEMECVRELAEFSSIDLERVAEEACLLLTSNCAKEEIDKFLKANVKYLPIC